jgi:alanine racemase
MSSDYFVNQPSTSEIRESMEGYSSWFEIDLDSLTHNLKAISERVGVEIMAVVKNNAYGHGLLPISAHLSRKGVRWFLVVKLNEAIRIKDAGIPGHVVNMDPVFTEAQYKSIVEKGITQAVYTEEVVRRLSSAAQEAGVEAEVIVKVDTGLRRVGVGHTEAASYIEEIRKLPGIDVKGMFTTFMQHPDSDSAQLNRFLKIDKILNDKGINLEFKSIASSDAVFHNPDSWLDMVRPGTGLYGVYPDPKDRISGLDLKQILSFKARIEHVKWVEKGESVTYFRRFIAPERMKVGTLHVGFYDCIPREMSNKGMYKVNGVYKPCIGSISLNHCLIDLTSTDASESDVIEVIGKEGRNSLANTAATANWMVYSLMNHLNPTTPRVYMEKKKPVALLEYP